MLSLLHIYFYTSIIYLTFLSSSIATLCSYPASSRYDSVGLTSDQLKVMRSISLPIWYTDRNSDPIAGVRDAIKNCQNQTSVIIIYGIPNKDCAGVESSSGSNKDMNDYKKFIETLKTTVGSAPVIYILEPDALALSINGNCGIANGYKAYVQVAYDSLIDTSAQIYIDVGFWTIIFGYSDRKAMSDLVNEIDTKNKLNGISINLSNYRSTPEMEKYCGEFINVSGRQYKCVIDTSRNGNGPSQSNEWCNYKGAGLGQLPTKSPSNNIDYYLYLKPPGELDGRCTGKSDSYQSSSGGAGEFDLSFFNILWNNKNIGTISSDTPSVSPSNVSMNGSSTSVPFPSVANVSRWESNNCSCVCYA